MTNPILSYSFVLDVNAAKKEFRPELPERVYFGKKKVKKSCWLLKCDVCLFVCDLISLLDFIGVYVFLCKDKI
jgi:hypothetical protein